MNTRAIEIIPVELPAHRDAARGLISEYLSWVAGVAQAHYGLTFDIEAMIQSDIEDRSKFYPPTGRFYLVQHADRYVGVGCLKRLANGVGEVQRMYVQPHARGLGAGRALIERLIEDARVLGYKQLRLESLKELAAAHNLYHSVGFKDIDLYSENSMKTYQAQEAQDVYRKSAVFMELVIEAAEQ